MTGRVHIFPLLFIAVAAVAITVAKSHSFLLEPKAYNNNYENDFFPNGCKPFQCPACPNIKSVRSKNMNLPERPEVTWKRGQRVTVRWAKNNHRGGFIRLAIVPVDKMFDHGYQRRLAFYYGCWQQNHHKCDREPCGADKKNGVLKTEIDVPKCVPDGIYSFSWVWFGGIDFTSKKSKFADYYSCSFIEIRGGAALADTCQPYFNAGPGNDVPNTCKVGNFEPGTCTQQVQCTDGDVFNGIPLAFQNENKPLPITKDLFVPPFPDFPPGPPDATSPPPSPSGTPSAPSSSPVSKNPSLKPICNGEYCCPGSCGACGGVGCSTRPGGPQDCCVGNIIDAKRYCERDFPPCKLS